MGIFTVGFRRKKFGKNFLIKITYLVSKVYFLFTVCFFFFLVEAILVSYPFIGVSIHERQFLEILELGPPVITLSYFLF